MDTSVKAGIKTSEGIFTAISLIVSFVINILVVMNVIEPTESANLAEIVTKGLTALATTIVAGVALYAYITGRMTLKSDALQIQAEKQVQNG